ncbi:MAG: gliding motility-associated C-terminal domain-containing protein [Crocinitomicaceae bacterium]|nr:gliding motility-associated C-terminal domain-containing protein [Crocinitomicaceae bacterium]
MKTIIYSLLLASTFLITQFAFGGGGTMVPPPPGLPPCAVNPPPGNTACIATPICNPHGFCGTTASSYTANYWSQLNSAFCGSIENNAFLSFTAQSSSISFNTYVYNCTDDEAIQIMIFEAASCNSGAVSSKVCVNEMYAQNTPYNVTANGLIPGNQYYIMIDGYGGDVCDYTFVATSGVAIPVGVDVGQDVTLCLDESITVTAYGGDGTYTWDAAPGLSGLNGATVTITPPSSVGTYSYTVNSQGGVQGCPSTNSYTVNVHVQACCDLLSNDLTLNNCDGVNGVYSVDGEVTITPPSSLVGDIVIKDCEGNTTTIPLGSAPYTYTLTGLSLSNPSCQIEAYFSGSPECSHVLTHVLNYTAPSSSTPTFNAISACEGSVAPTLPSASLEGITGTWSPATINTSTPGTTVYTFTPGPGYCAPNATLNITISPKPDVNVVSPAIFNCLDPSTNTFTLSGSSSTPGVTYGWTDLYGGDNGFVSGQTTTAPVVNSAGFYIISVTGPAPDNCISVDTVEVISGGYNPIVSIDPAINLDCLNPTTTIVGHVSNSSGTQTGITFGWTTADGNITSSTSNSSIDINSPGTYVLTAVDATHGCTSSDLIEILGDLNQPILDILTPQGTEITCNDPIVAIAGTSDIGGIGIWTASNPSNIAQSGDTLVYNVIGVIGAGTYTYTVTNPANHCSSDTTITITLNNTPPTVSAGPDLFICENGTVTLQGSASSNSGSTITFSWDATNGSVTMYDFSNIPNPTVPSGATFTLTATDDGNGCIASDTAIVTEVNNPTIFSDTTICNTSFLVPADSIFNNGSGTWTMNPTNSGTFSPSASVVAPIFTPNAGVTNVTLTLTNECGSDNANLIFVPKPIVIAPPAYSCGDMSEVLTTSSYGTGMWTVQDNPSTPWLEDTALVFVTGPGTAGGMTPQTVTVSSNPTAGQYTLTFTDAACGYSETVTLNFIDYPWVNINDTTLCMGVTYTLDLDSKNATSYVWNNGEIGTSIQVTQSGNYTVTASNECYSIKDSAFIDFKVCEIEAPNVISLSSQAGNNIWFVDADGIADFNCIILNRWGNLIYQYNDITSGWDGKDMKGHPVTEGVYFYKIDATREGGEKIMKQGFIHVVE